MAMPAAALNRHVVHIFEHCSDAIPMEVAGGVQQITIPQCFKSTDRVRFKAERDSIRQSTIKAVHFFRI